MAYSAGTAFLEVTPSFLNVESLLAKGARDIAKSLDKQLGGQLGDAMRNAARKAQPETERAAKLLGKTFADNAIKHVRSAAANIAETDRILAPLRKELIAISEIDITKGFDEKGFIDRVEKAYAALRRAQQDAQGKNAVSRFANAGNAAGELGAVKDIVEAARKRGFAAGDAFGDAYLSRLKAMDRVLPDLKITAKSSQEERAVAALKSRIAEAMKLQVGGVATRDNNPLNLRIGAKIDGEDLKREMASIEGLLDHFVERFNSIELVLPLDKARQQAAAFTEDVKTQQERANEQLAAAYLKAWDDALAEQGRRERKARADLSKMYDDALAEDFKRDKQVRDALIKAHEQAIAEDYKRQRKIQDDFLEAWDRAIAEDQKRLKRQQDQFQTLWDQAIAEDYKRQRKIQDDFLSDWDRAIAESYKRQLKAQQNYQDAWDQAVAEDWKRQKRERDKFLDDWDQAIQENAARQKRLSAQAFSRTTAGEAQTKTSSAADRIIDLPVHLQANPIDREMAAIRARIKALGNLKIGVDLDAESFADQAEAEFRRLEKIAHDKKIDIEVRTDAAKAATELGAVLALLHRIDGQKAEVKVDADSAATSLLSLAQNLSLSLGRLGALIAVGASIGTAMVPAAAAAASTIGSIGTAALAAGSGVGVLMLAFSGIGDAVKALSQYADNQAKSNTSLARSAGQVEAAEDQVRNAELALANTRRNNATAAIRANRAIQEAIEDQRDAVIDVARANKDAVQSVADAQRDLTEANRADIDARQRLNDAYRDARRALADLNSQIRGNALDQRQATLDIAKAKAELDKILSNPRATQAEREQADITYQQRLLQMDDLRRKGTQLSDEQRKQFKEGIEGSEQVTRARQDIAAADARRLDAQRALSRAQEDLVRTQLDGSRKLRDSEQKVLDARAAAADQQKDAAYAEYQATQSIIAARRALENATNRDAIAGGAQLDNLNQAMGKLSPTAQAFARYIFGLRDAFFALRAAADPVLAGVWDAMRRLLGETSEEAIKKLAPLFDFVHRVAVALGGLFVRFAKMLQGPTFTKFFSYISKTAVPTLELLFQLFENITIGVLNLFLAFTPLTGDVNKGLLGMTESFRKWSESLETNQGFQRLIAFMRESGPQIMDLLGGVVKAITKLVIAAAPVGTVVVKIFTKLFEWINKIPEKVLITLVAGIAAAAAAIGAFAAATALASLEVPGLVAGAIAALVVGFSALAGSSANVGEILKKTWEAIKVGAVVAFDFVKKAIIALRPVFDDMVEAALAFYNDGLKPAWDLVVTLFRSAFNALRPAFDDIGGFFVKLGKLAFFLYDQAILPAFKGIMAVTKVLLEVLKPVFDIIGTIIGTLAKVVFWLLNNVFMPVIGGIVMLLVKVLRPVIEFLWKFILKPIFTAIGILFQIVAAIIKVQIGIITIALKVLGAIFKWLYEKAIKPVWDLLVDKVFRPMGDWISKHIGPPWKKALEALAEQWDKFKKRLGAVIYVIIHFGLNEGLLKGYNWLADKFGITPNNVKIPEPTGDWYTKASFATGGAVIGPGTATSDSIPARLSRGEHVLTAAEVRAAGGHQAIYAWRQELMRGAGAGYAVGGAVGREIGDGFGDWLKKTAKNIGKKASDVFDSTMDFLKDPVGSLTALAKGLFDKIPGKDTWIVQRLMTLPVKVLDALKDKVKGLFLGGGGQDGTTNGAVGGTSNSLGGSLGMINILRQAFPGLALNSGYRPGAITVTGNTSYHARNRAIDVPPRADVFNWLHEHYPNSRELIFSPMGKRQIHNGKPHVYSGAVRSTHFNHVHWAYDRGGLLPDTRRMPGQVMQVFHGRRTPDKVLTDTQWQHMAALANQAQVSGAAGNTYNFPYRDTTLNYEELNRWSARQDALNRVNRPNY